MNVRDIRRTGNGVWKISFTYKVDEWVTGLHRVGGDDHYGELTGTCALTVTINAREILETADELKRGQAWDTENGLMLTSALYVAARFGGNEWNRHVMNDLALCIDSDRDAYHKVLAIEAWNV